MKRFATLLNNDFFLRKSIPVYLLVLLSVASCHTTHSLNNQKGYFYSLVFDGTKKSAQFSSVYYSECSAETLDQKTTEYAMRNGYGDFKVIGVFTKSDDAESDKKSTKNKYQDSGFDIGGDNNFFGDCQP